MARKHKVRTHSWLNGILQFRDFLFDDIEAAMNFVMTSEHSTNADIVKVYNDNDQVVHEANPSTAVINSYA
jgi:hypothetical protein